MPLDYFNIKTGLPPRDSRDAAMFWQCSQRQTGTVVNRDDLLEEMWANHKACKKFAKSQHWEETKQSLHQNDLKRPTDSQIITEMRDMKAMLRDLEETQENIQKLAMSLVAKSTNEASITATADAFLSSRNMTLTHHGVTEGMRHCTETRGGIGMCVQKGRRDFLHNNNICKPMEDSNSWCILANQPRNRSYRKEVVKIGNKQVTVHVARSKPKVSD